jgi:hypothetical protein
MSTKRHAASVGVLAVFLFFNVATSKAPSGSGSPSPAPLPASAAPVTRTLADLDVGSVKSALGCPAPKNEACRVLDDFAGASKIEESPAAGTTKVWMGQTFAIGGSANGKKQYYFLQMQQGSLAVDPSITKESQLSTIGTGRWLRPDNASEEKDSAALLAAVKAGKAAPTGNGAAAFVKKPAEASVFRAMVRTTGASSAIVKIGEHNSFVRRFGNRVLVIEYADGALIDDAKAWCAEAWPLP